MKKHQVEIIAFHGWAHDAHCWDSLQLYLPDTIHFSSWDRGYFGSSNLNVEFSSENNLNILIAHSFGLHFIPDHLIQKADGLILCGSFLHFGKEKVIQRMCSSIKSNTGYVLSQFHANCAYPAQSEWRMPRTFSGSLILSDLESLGVSRFDHTKIKDNLPLLLLTGDSDRIVDKENILNLAKLLYMDIVTIPKAGHGFIYTKPEKTASHILKFIQLLTT
jgi:hypothetical protein